MRSNSARHYTGELYWLNNKPSMEPIGIDGMGQNAKWAIRDFAGIRPVIILYSEHDRMRHDLYQDICNANKRLNDHTEMHCMMICTDDAQIENNLSGNFIIQGYDAISKQEKTIYMSSNMIFSARGSKLDETLVLGENVMQITMPQFNHRLKTNAAGKQALAQTPNTVPPGNLSTVAATWDYVFGHLDITNLRTMNQFKLWKKGVIELASQLDLNISEDFFSIAKVKFGFAHSTPHVPKGKHLNILISKAFEKHVMDGNGEIVDISWNEFSDLCKKLYEKTGKIEQLLDEKSDAEMTSNNSMNI